MTKMIKLSLEKTIFLLFITFLSGITGLQTAFADSITMVTRLTAGSAVTLYAMADTTLSVDWGDGSYKEVASGKVQGNLLGQTVTLRSTGAITSLDCSGSQIFSIDLSDAGSLRSLYCSDNTLFRIDVDSCALLRELDCSRCNLSQLSVTQCPALRLLNCSGNRLSELNLNACRGLEQLDCSGNRLTALYVDSLPMLQSLWADGNNMEQFSATHSDNLYSLSLNDNHLAELSTNEFYDLSDLLVARNNLSGLDLSGSSELNTLVCDSNRLESIELSDNAALYLLMCANNRLKLNNLYPPAAATNYQYTPQQPFAMPQSVYALKTIYNFSSFTVNHSGSNVGTLAFYDLQTGKALTKGVSADYYGSTRLTRFLTGHDSVYMEVTSTLYPDLVLRSEPFTIGTPTAVSTASLEDGLSVRIIGRTLCLRAGTAMPVTVYSAGGIKIWKGIVNSDEVRIPLRPGVYFAGNKKVLIR